MGGKDTDRLLERPAAATETIRVLVVDEDAKRLATALEQTDEQFAVETAATAAAGLNHLEETSFDCIVSSYQLPATNGLELFEAVRERDSRIPFILSAGAGAEEIVERAFAAGVSDYVQGGETAVLANRIETEVRRHRNKHRAERMKATLEASHDGVAIFDSEGQFQYVNDAYASVYGYSPEELVGGGWEQLYPEEEIEHYENEIVPTLHSEGGWIGDCECLHRDGFRFRSTHSISQLEDGGHICVIHHGSVRASET
ncbi:MAG: PAS domain S-box protein [Halovenus sp.]